MAFFLRIWADHTFREMLYPVLRSFVGLFSFELRQDALDWHLTADAYPLRA